MGSTTLRLWDVRSSVFSCSSPQLCETWLFGSIERDWDLYGRFSFWQLVSFIYLPVHKSKSALFIRAAKARVLTKELTIVCIINAVGCFPVKYSLTLFTHRHYTRTHTHGLSLSLSLFLLVNIITRLTFMILGVQLHALVS